MRLLVFILLSIFSLAQTNDTINLNEVNVIDYSQFKQFRPKFKKVVRLTDHTSFGINIFSNLQLPKVKGEIEIVAIEILFESKIKNKNYCNEYYYFKPILIQSIKNPQNLIHEKWFEVDKDYTGKYIFPVSIKLNPTEAKNWLIGFESAYDNPFCPEANGYFDLVDVKPKSDVFVKFKSTPNASFKKQELFGNYTLNYRIYYRI